MTNNNVALVFDVAGDFGFIFNSPFYAKLLDAVKNNSVVPEEFEDIFELEVLVGFNDDGSNRGILRMA